MEGASGRVEDQVHHPLAKSVVGVFGDLPATRRVYAPQAAPRIVSVAQAIGHLFLVARCVVAQQYPVLSLQAIAVAHLSRVRRRAVRRGFTLDGRNPLDVIDHLETVGCLLDQGIGDRSGTIGSIGQGTY